MSIETIVEQIIETEIITEVGDTELVIESVVQTELVTENIGPMGPAGGDIPDMPSFALIFENKLI